MKLDVKLKIVVHSTEDWSGTDEYDRRLLNAKVRFYPCIIDDENKEIRLNKNGLDIGYFIPNDYRTREYMKGPILSIIEEILGQEVEHLKPQMPVPLYMDVSEKIIEDILSVLTAARYEVLKEEFEYTFKRKYNIVRREKEEPKND